VVNPNLAGSATQANTHVTADCEERRPLNMLMYALWVSPFVAMVIFHRWLWIGIPLSLLLVIAAWCQTIHVVDLQVDAELALIEQMPNPTEADLMYDGVGERITAAMFGWLPSFFMLCCGVVAALLLRWLRRRGARTGDAAARALESVPGATP
jgi:hypothetical protein